MQVNSQGIQDYLISYKGHGQIETASKTNSIGHVVAHENRHIKHYRDYAQFHDKEIVRENISITYAFIDGKLVAVAGKATAAMRDKAETNNSNAQPLLPDNTSQQTDTSQGDDNNAKKQKLDILLTSIDTALDKLDARIEDANSNSTPNTEQNENMKLTRLMQKRANLEAKKQEIAGKKNKLDADKLAKMVEDLLAGIAGLFDQAAGLIKANYELKAGKQNSGPVDKDYEVEVPDYPMLFTGIVVDTMI